MHALRFFARQAVDGVGVGVVGLVVVDQVQRLVDRVCAALVPALAQPLLRRLGIVATARASFGVYNDQDDVNALVAALDAAGRVFSPEPR